ncbi:hypothetical protein [Gordonia paraffinivorans]|nr:hypothetical protein [Gordonia paraffinivorans]
MTTASNSVGIGPWSFDAGPFAIILLVVIIGIVVYYIRKDD